MLFTLLKIIYKEVCSLDYKSFYEMNSKLDIKNLGGA